MFPVLDIDQNDIVDTNGAGDAFVGGMALLSAYLHIWYWYWPTMQCSKISRLYECDFYPAVFFPTLIIAPYKTANIYVLLRKKQSLFLEAISTLLILTLTAPPNYSRK